MQNVAYLEIDDFNSDGSIKSHINNNKPVVLMLQANFCGYCKKAGPALSQFAKESPDLLVATIVTDGEPSEKACSKLIKLWNPNHRGVPDYMGFSPDGKFSKLHTGGRGVEDLKKFAA